MLARTTQTSASAKKQTQLSSRAIPSAGTRRSPLRSAVAVKAQDRDSGFLTGFLVGGVVCGTLGFLFAPQISKAVLGDDQRLKLPRFMEEETAKDPEQTKQDLIEKIAQLNASIDEVALKLGSTQATDKVEVSA